MADYILTQEGVAFLEFVLSGGAWRLLPGYALSFVVPNAEEVILAEALSRFSFTAADHKGFFPYRPDSAFKNVCSPLIVRRLEALGFITQTFTADQAAILQTMKNTSRDRLLARSKHDRLGLPGMELDEEEDDD